MAKITHCPVCGLALDAVERFGNRDAYHLTCQRCGRYGMSGTLLAVGFPTATGQQRAGLMAALRDATARGEEVLLSTDNWEGTATHFATFSIPQKLRRLLEYIGSKSQNRAGARVVINDQLEFPTFAATDVEEFNFLRRALLQQKLLEVNGDGLTLTLEGWEAYRPNRGGTPGTCFVAMAFDATLDAAYDQGIRPAVAEDCAFTIVRVDRVEHNDNINDRIISEIRACQFLVADFTLHRNGVYFEAGFAMGLGRPVVWTCRRDQMREAHFDTRPYNHIIWDTPAELREKLTNRIKATVRE
jgi:hypothetical protein